MKKIFILMMLLPALAFAGERELMIKGGKAYVRDKYGTALDYYKQAAAFDEQNPEPEFNIAAAQYKLQYYKIAAEIFEKLAKEQQKKIQQDSYFNAGNARYMASEKEQAKENYKQAILLKRNDKAAIHNLQVLLEEKKENEKSENPEQNDDQNKPNDNDENQNNDENNEMSESQAQRIVQMAKEQEQKDSSRQNKQYGEASNDVEKDW